MFITLVSGHNGKPILVNPQKISYVGLRCGDRSEVFLKDEETGLLVNESQADIKALIREMTLEMAAELKDSLDGLRGDLLP